MKSMLLLSLLLLWQWGLQQQHDYSSIIMIMGSILVLQHTDVFNIQYYYNITTLTFWLSIIEFVWLLQQSGSILLQQQQQQLLQ